MRPAGKLPRPQNVPAEVGIFRFAGQAIEQHHGLQHAAGCHALMLARLVDVALARLIERVYRAGNQSRDVGDG